MGIEGISYDMCEVHLGGAVRNAFQVKKGDKFIYKEAGIHYCVEGHPIAGTEKRGGKGWL